LTGAKVSGTARRYGDLAARTGLTGAVPVTAGPTRRDRRDDESAILLRVERRGNGNGRGSIAVRIGGVVAFVGMIVFEPDRGDLAQHQSGSATQQRQNAEGRRDDQGGPWWEPPASGPTRVR
jgi:hypothetical protein